MGKMDEDNQQNGEKTGARRKSQKQIRRRKSFQQGVKRDASLIKRRANSDTSVHTDSEPYERSDIEESSQVEENLENFIETVEDRDIEYILQNSELFKSFCSDLLKAFQNLERKEAAFEHLLKIIKKLSIKSNRLLESVKTWLPKRKSLLNMLEKDVKTMDLITKVCNTGRLVSSVIDSASLIGGLIFRNSNSSSASIAFDVANVFGVLGFTSSAVELYSWKSKLERLMKKFQDDQDLFAPIQEWFQTNNELEEAMKEIFSFEITEHIVRQFDKAMHKEINQAELLRMVLWPILQEDQQRFRDTNLIRNLIAFTMCPAATDWCRWIVLRHHKANLDIETMLLQLINPQRFAGSQSFAVMDKASKNPVPIAIVGRIGLNIVTMYDAIDTLRNSAMVEELRQLRDHLQEEMTALEQISKFLTIRKPE